MLLAKLYSLGYCFFVVVVITESFMWQSHIRRCLVALGYEDFSYLTHLQFLGKFSGFLLVFLGVSKSLLYFVSSERLGDKECYMAHVTSEV